MKKNLIKFFIITAGIAVTTACTKDFDELNGDPTKGTPQNFNPNALLSTSELIYTGSDDFSYDTWRANLIHCSTMMQQFASVNGFWVGDKSRDNQAYQEAYWIEANRLQVKNVVDLYKFTEGKSQYTNLHQVSRVMRSLVFARLADLYGDIPYSEAGLGYYTGVVTPKYDSQESVYLDILSELSDASSLLGTGSDKVTSDLIYGGDVAKWKKFANSLQLRVAMRLVNKNAAKAQEYAEKAIAAGILESSTDDALVKHQDGPRLTINRNSQIFALGYQRPNDRIAQTFVNWMVAKSDPRLKLIAEEASAFDAKGAPTSYSPATFASIGMPNGYDANDGGLKKINTAPGYPAKGMDGYVRVATAMINGAAPTHILTAGEAQLYAAEAKQRGWNVSGTALERYRKGVANSILTLSAFGLSVDATEANTYANSLVLSAGSELKDINEQIWAVSGSTFNYYESFSNYRRSGFPVLTPTTYPTQIIAGIPQRFVYPISEASVNSKNLKVAQAAQGLNGNIANDLQAKVWFAKE